MNINESNQLLRDNGYRFINLSNAFDYDDADDAPAMVLAPSGETMTRAEAEKEIIEGRTGEYRVEREANLRAAEIKSQEELTRIDMYRVGFVNIPMSKLVEILPARPVAAGEYPHPFMMKGDEISVLGDVKWVELWRTVETPGHMPFIVETATIEGMELRRIGNSINSYWVRS